MRPTQVQYGLTYFAVATVFTENFANVNIESDVTTAVFTLVAISLNLPVTATHKSQ
jgi:hypothetical protein